MDLKPGACSQSTGQLPVSFNSVAVAVVTVAAMSYMVTIALGMIGFRGFFSEIAAGIEHVLKVGLIEEFVPMVFYFVVGVPPLRVLFFFTV